VCIEGGEKGWENFSREQQTGAGKRGKKGKGRRKPISEIQKAIPVKGISD